MKTHLWNYSLTWGKLSEIFELILFCVKENLEIFKHICVLYFRLASESLTLFVHISDLLEFLNIIWYQNLHMMNWNKWRYKWYYNYHQVCHLAGVFIIDQSASLNTDYKFAHFHVDQSNELGWHDNIMPQVFILTPFQLMHFV